MKAIVYTQYGSPDALRSVEMANPVPGDGEVLVKIHAAAVNAADCHLLKGAPLLVRLETGLLSPKHTILGADIAGRVETIGRNVTLFRPGDAVYGDISGSGWGGIAEYAAVPESVLAPAPVKLSFEQAAAVPMAAVTALQGLRDRGNLQPGQSVLIYGASGGVGTFAVQIACALGARVTAVCSTRNVEMVHGLGAVRVLDYSREEIGQGGQRYDLILAANGNRPLSDYTRLLNPGGTCVISGGSMRQIFAGLLTGPIRSMVGDRKVVNLVAKPSRDDLCQLNELFDADRIAPVIDRVYPLDNLAGALRYVGEGHARGKVVITVADN